jgi:hypothetical protein
MIEYKFASIYRFADIIYQSVKSEVEFFNYNIDEFILSATSFQKKSLLHIYTESTLYNYFNRDFCKNGDCYEEEYIEEWHKIFSAYNVKLKYPDCDFYNVENDNCVYMWFLQNELCFKMLFKKISLEVVLILFANKNFLLDFNILARKSFEELPKERLSAKGIVRRTAIPAWVKKAVFYRDYGRCVFCNKDLTGIFSAMPSSNYDHIIPLFKQGFNDICNMLRIPEHTRPL